MCLFVVYIQSMKVHPDMEDRIVWNLSRGGCFSVKSLFRELKGPGLGPFSRKLIWNHFLPSKVSFLGSVVGMNFDSGSFEKRGRQLANRCPLCGEKEENMDHLFLLFNKGRALGFFICPVWCLLGTSWVS